MVTQLKLHTDNKRTRVSHIDGKAWSVGRASFHLQILDIKQQVTALIMNNFPYQLLIGLDVGNSFNFELQWSSRTLSIGPGSMVKVPQPEPPSNLNDIVNVLKQTSRQKLTNETILFESIMVIGPGPKTTDTCLIRSEDLESILSTHRQVFANNEQDLGTIAIESHHINTTSEHPVYVPQFRLSKKDNDDINIFTKQLISLDRIQPTISRWNTPIFTVPKKDGTRRLIQDLRKVNQVTKLEAFPIPLIEDVIDRLQGATYISTLDIAWGYWQVPIHPDDRHKTAFTTTEGRFEWKVMTMGLKNAPFTFQMIMQQVFGPLLYKSAIPYLDDVVIFSKSSEEHRHALEAVFKQFIHHNIKLRREKCHFFRSEVEYLGFIINGHSYKPAPRVIEAIEKFPAPNSTKAIQRFMGMCNWLRKHIQSFSELSAHMSARQANGTKFEWSEDLEAEFQLLKRKAKESVELAIYNPSFPLELHTDASSVGVGAALFQVQSPHGLRPIAFFSKKLNSSQSQWSASHLESYAVLLSCEHFQVYLLNGRFKLVTDHSALQWMRDRTLLKGKLHRWFIRLSAFDLHH